MNMENSSLIRFGKLGLGGLGSLAVLALTLAGVVRIAPWALIARGVKPYGVVLIYSAVFFFPYLFMSSLIQPGEAVFMSDAEEGVMGSYGAQNENVRRYRRQMLAIVFGVVVTGICVFSSNLHASGY